MTMMLSALAFVALFFIIPGPRIYWPLLWVALPLAVYALFLLVQGSWQLHRALNPKSPKTLATNTQPVFVSSAVTTALPPARQNASVTEATTDLLSAHDRRVSEPVQRKDRTTAEIDADGLM
jgi:hypothetical protein